MSKKKSFHFKSILKYVAFRLESFITNNLLILKKKMFYFLIVKLLIIA